MAALPRTAVAPCQHLDRLPRGTDRDIGGGYATAMAAAGATACSPLVVDVATAVIGVQVAAAGDTVPMAFRVMAPIGLAIGTLQTAVTVAVGGRSVCWPGRCTSGPGNDSASHPLPYPVVSTGDSRRAERYPHCGEVQMAA